MGIAERKSREQRTRREAVLRAARKLFLQKGFANTSMDEMAAEAEVAEGTLYLYFRSKDEITYTLVSPILEDFLQRIHSFASDPVSRRMPRCEGWPSVLPRRTLRSPKCTRLSSATMQENTSHCFPRRISVNYAT